MRRFLCSMKSRLEVCRWYLQQRRIAIVRVCLRCHHHLLQFPRSHTTPMIQTTRPCMRGVLLRMMAKNKTKNMNRRSKSRVKKVSWLALKKRSRLPRLSERLCDRMRNDEASKEIHHRQSSSHQASCRNQSRLPNRASQAMNHPR